MNIVFIGHVDHGKSTTVGRMLLDTGMIEQHVIDGLKKVAEEKGKATFEFAFVMDQLKEERERGVTIDVAHKRMNTDKYYFTIIDAPGHRDFVKNMITGTSQADAAVVVVGASEGVQAQTKEHVFLSRTLGVKQIIIGINKMDAVNYDEKKYTDIKADMTKLLASVGFKAAEIPFVPYSAYKGENTAKKSALMPWYKGPSMIDALNGLKAPDQPTNLPLRAPIQDVYSITGIGTVPVGRIETGIMRPNDKVHFMPSDKPGEVKSIEMHHEMIAEAKPGDNVGFNVRGIAKTDIKRGDVCGPSSSPPTVAKLFKAQIMVLNHPSVISAGYTPIFHCHTAQIACTVEQLLAKLDPKTGGVKEGQGSKDHPDPPAFIKTGDSAIVLIRPTKPMVIEEAKAFPQLGRFAIRDMGQTVAAGLCMKVEEKV